MCYFAVGFVVVVFKVNKADWEQGFGEREAKQNSKHYTANKLVVEQKKRKSGNEMLCGKM